MHRGYPADKFLTDMMREIHRYFEFPKSNKMAVGLGGGHSGFTVCLMHMMNATDESQHVFVDTPEPESDLAQAGGFFRQAWGRRSIMRVWMPRRCSGPCRGASRSFGEW